MMQVMVRKRWGRPGELRRQVDRWFYRNRPKLAVVAAFVVACLLGLVASAGLQSLAPGAAPPAASAGPR